MLELKKVAYAYQEGQTILKELTLEFREGHVYGLLGANGSGKSTVFLSLMGLLKPQKGIIAYQGQSLSYKKKQLHEYRQEVALVFQNPDQQIFYSIVKDDVAFALRNLGYDEQEITARVDNALSELGISHLKESPVQYLSYGQKKRVAIAGALVLDTKWLLLDEPTAGLDPEGRRLMMAVINRLAKQGKNIIISSHDMDLVYDCCDYFYLLADGKLLTQGTKQLAFNDRQLLLQANLEQPWLVKIHQQFDLPLFDSEQSFFSQATKKMRGGHKNE